MPKDLYLIRPPKEAPHAAISPSDIVISGDSAGGGLTIALLQVLRDTGLPLPAGGIPISPWCDLTHSFPSIHINTDTDVIPKYGLSMYRPSALWPPPSDDMTEKIHSSLRSRIREAALHTYKSSDKVKRDLEKRPSFWKKKFSFGVRRKSHSNCKRSQSVPRSRSTSFDETELDRDDVRVQAVSKSINETAVHDGNVENNLDLGTSASIPKADRTDTQTLSVVTESGEELVVNDQVHLYTVNNMLTHPLVSPAYAYLGGLPPLLVIASDHEVLRDEIIYMFVINRPHSPTELMHALGLIELHILTGTPFPTIPGASTRKWKVLNCAMGLRTFTFKYTIVRSTFFRTVIQ